MTGVSYARMVPFTHYVWDEDLFVGAGKVQDVYFNSISPDYFKTMRIPLYDGRDFAWTDTAATGLKIILNQAAVKLLFPDRNPLGQFVSKQEGKTNCSIPGSWRCRRCKIRRPAHSGAGGGLFADDPG